MSTRLRSNGFLLIIPLLIWNAVFWPLLPAGAGGSEPIPMNPTPMLVFARIAVLGRSLIYASIAVGFVAVHASLGFVRAGI